jgi:hypothetical protein
MGTRMVVYGKAAGFYSLFAFSCLSMTRCSLGEDWFVAITLFATQEGYFKI